MELSNFSDEIRCFPNGQAALEAIQKLEENAIDKPDIVFLDINMPVLDGWQFLDALEGRAIANELRIYMLSSSIDEVDLKRAMHYPMVSKYIAKPISTKSLEEFN